jgi:hypothetical protein
MILRIVYRKKDPPKPKPDIRTDDSEWRDEWIRFWSEKLESLKHHLSEVDS